LTPRQSDRSSKIVGGLFFAALIGLLTLLSRGYHTFLLILIGVMFGIGVFTFTYDRRKTLEGLALFACIGLLSLIVQGYQTLFLAIFATICGITALAFIYQMRQAWYPDERIALS
jgi:hypothetical protein